MDRAIECPNCGLVNPSSAQRCDCGFIFSNKSKEQLAKIRRSNKLKKYKGGICVSIFISVLGIVLTAISIPRMHISSIDIKNIEKNMPQILRGPGIFIAGLFGMIYNTIAILKLRKRFKKQ